MIHLSFEHACHRVRLFHRLPLGLAVSALCAGPALAQPSAPPADGQLSTVEVVGRSESGAYHAEEAAGAKTDLPLRELPQSVRIVTRQAIDDLGATKLDDVLDYVGGVSRQNNFGGLWDNIAIRGLPGNENTGMATCSTAFPRTGDSTHRAIWPASSASSSSRAPRPRSMAAANPAAR